MFPLVGLALTITAAPDGSPLAAGTTYYITVDATNAYGTSGLSNEANVGAGGFAPNTSWFTAQTVPLASSGSGELGTATQSIDQQGEALWYKFPVSPDEQVQVSLSNLPADYDISVFSDISQTFTEESSSGLNLADARGRVTG